MPDNLWQPLLRHAKLFLSICTLIIVQASDTIAEDAKTTPDRMQIVSPRSLPKGACVPQIVVHAVDSNGTLINSFSESVSINGILIDDGDTTNGASLLPSGITADFDQGRLFITPETADAHRISVGASGLEIVSDNVQWSASVQSLPSWLRLLPPIFAIGLAILLKEVNSSLLLATLGGCLIFFAPIDLASAGDMLCQTLVNQIAVPDHASIILFTVLLGAMIGLMNDSGGTHAVVHKLAAYADTRRKGMVLTWLMGLVVFFDDYANTMLIGGAMRPLSDRLKLSREKLAFLIDSTAAPIAGIALVSTWVGFEIDQIASGLTNAGIADDSGQLAGKVFLATIPYRIYPIATLIMVATIAFTGRDFGAMLKAERAAIKTPPQQQSTTESVTSGMSFAIVPVLVLTSLVVICYINDVDSYRLLIIASLVASTIAFILPLMSRRMAFQECVKSWTNGISSMIPAIVVLILAWAVSDICRPDKLDTAGFIVDLTGSSTSPVFLPAIAFLVSGAIAISIGSSFTTMALLIPLVCASDDQPAYRRICCWF